MIFDFFDNKFLYVISILFILFLDDSLDKAEKYKRGISESMSLDSIYKFLMVELNNSIRVLINALGLNGVNLCVGRFCDYLINF